VIFTYRGILQHGEYDFTSLQKEGMVQIFIALKNPSPGLGLNPQTLGPMASMLTTEVTWLSDTTLTISISDDSLL
jgi:hypothetical protein